MEEHRLNKYNIAIATLILVIIGVIIWVIIAITNEKNKDNSMDIIQFSNNEITQAPENEYTDEYEGMEPCMTNMEYMEALSNLIKDNANRYDIAELNEILESKLKGRALREIYELESLDMNKIDKLICSWYPDEGKIVIMCKAKDHNYLTSWMRQFMDFRSSDTTDKDIAREYASYNEYAYNDYRIITVGIGYESIGDTIIDYMGEKDEEVEIEFESRYIVTDRGVFEVQTKEGTN